MAQSSDTGESAQGAGRHGQTARAPFGHGAAQRPVVITHAAQSFQEQQHARVRKYTILMAIRVPALVAAAVSYSTWHNPWIALGIIVLSIPLPWIAVLIANDGPPRKKNEIGRFEHREPTGNELESKEHRTIDG